MSNHRLSYSFPRSRAATVLMAIASSAGSACAFQVLSSGYASGPAARHPRPVTELHSKKILCFFDGTGNNVRDFAPNKDNDVNFSNVVKLHLLAGGDVNGRRNDIPGQICLYERGLGGNDIDNKFLSTLEMVAGDLNKQVDPMRARLQSVYEPGDKLYFIGFSRGSAAARKFASELNDKGLMSKDDKLVERPPIEFLGCFDTVSAQLKKRLFKILLNRVEKGIPPSGVLDEKGTVAPNIKRGVHCVALDDNRMWNNAMETYPPVLMGAQEGREDDIHEVWFPGEHGDIGGPYYRDGLADGACLYMKEWLEKDGISFLTAGDINPECYKIDDHPEVKVDADCITINPNPSDVDHHSEFQYDTPSNRPLYVVKDDDMMDGAVVKIHESVLDHMEADEKYRVNPNLKTTKFVVVTSLGKVSEEKTTRLAELVKK